MQSADFEPLQFAQQLLIGGQINMQLASDLEISRGTAKLGRQGLDRLLDRPPLAP